MRRRKPLAPGFESLETLTLLSTAALPVARLAAAQVVHTATAASPLRLSGRLGGTYSISLLSSTSARFTLQGSGPVRGMGPVRMSAQTAADVSDTMDVTLSGRRGSVTLRLTSTGGTAGTAGTAQPASYTILNGTGAYAGAQGTGTAEITVLPRLSTLGMQGRMTLVLKS